MEEYNVKCTKCGYIFLDETEGDKCVCPLCENECDRNEAELAYKEVEQNFITKQKKTKRSMIVNMLTLGLSFTAFVIIIYFLIAIIAAAGK